MSQCVFSDARGRLAPRHVKLYLSVSNRTHSWRIPYASPQIWCANRDEMSEIRSSVSSQTAPRYTGGCTRLSVPLQRLRRMACRACVLCAHGQCQVPILRYAQRWRIPRSISATYVDTSTTQRRATRRSPSPQGPRSRSSRTIGHARSAARGRTSSASSERLGCDHGKPS